MQEDYGRDGWMQFRSVARSDAQEPPGFDYKNDPSLDPDVEPVGFLGLFRYADKYDYLLLGLGLIFAMANGVGLVFYSNPFGDLTEAFAPGADPTVIVEQTKKAMYSFLKNAAVVLVASWAMSASWAISSERQSIRCRIAYLSAILRQEPGWHERQKST